MVNRRLRLTIMIIGKVDLNFVNSVPIVKHQRVTVYLKLSKVTNSGLKVTLLLTASFPVTWTFFDFAPMAISSFSWLKMRSISASKTRKADSRQGSSPRVSLSASFCTACWILKPVACKSKGSLHTICILDTGGS